MEDIDIPQEDLNVHVNVTNQDGVKLVPGIHKVIEEMNFQQDELDKVDFNPIDYINKQFPNEQSLVNLDPILTKLHIKIAQSDSEIAKEIRHLSSAGNKASNDLNIAQTSIVELFTKIHEIKAKVSSLKHEKNRKKLKNFF